MTIQPYSQPVQLSPTRGLKGSEFLVQEKPLSTFTPRSFDQRFNFPTFCSDPLLSMLHPDNTTVDSSIEALHQISDMNATSILPLHQRKAHFHANFNPNATAMNNFSSQIPKHVLHTSDFGSDAHELNGLDLDYHILEYGFRKENIASHPVGQPLAVHSDSNSEFVAAAAAVAAASTPLVDSDFYLGDILGDDGITPQGLPGMIRNDTEEEDLSGAPRECAQKNLRFSDQAVTSIDLVSQESGQGDNDISYGIRASQYERSNCRNEPFDNALSTVTGSKMCGDEAMDSSLAYTKSSCLTHPALPGYTDHALPQGRLFMHGSQTTKSFDDPKVEAEDALCSSDNLSLCESEKMDSEVDSGDGGGSTAINSPASGMSMTSQGSAAFGSHPDTYENLTDELRAHVDRLREKISAMPRRKLRESLAREVTLEDVEPLMFINRDELAGMLGLGVTTWKTFMHSLGVPRWPARALKSQKVKEKKILEKKAEAENRGDAELVHKLERDLSKLRTANIRRQKLLRNNAKLRVANVTIKKTNRHGC